VQQGGGSGPAAWSVCLGPGEELADLGPVLAHLSGSTNDGIHVRVTTLSDISGLMAGFAGRGRLILQGDGFPEEDIGFVRRFLANNPHWSLVLVGKDAGTRPARVMLGMDRTRWLALPPDLHQLRELVRYPNVPEPPVWEQKDEESQPAPPPPAAATPIPLDLPVSRTPPLEPQQARAAGPPPTPAPLPAPTPAPQPAAPTPEAARLPATPPPPPPPTEREPEPEEHLESALDPDAMRAQVAALADIAQRLELSLETAGESVDPGDPARELARLRRFTHMLGHVTAPAARGAERFDLGDLLEEQLATVALEAPKEMRFLPKGERGLTVLGDRSAVATALEGLLAFARACAQPTGVVKAPYRRGAAGHCEIELDLPAGPLAGGDPARALRPGGVQEELPDLGPADLPAAAALIGAQGGTLRIEPGVDQRLRVVLELPPAPEAEAPARPRKR